MSQKKVREVEEIKLVPFEFYTECPKCKSKKLLRSFHERPEHLSVSCWDCGYDFPAAERTADAE